MIDVIEMIIGFLAIAAGLIGAVCVLVYFVRCVVTDPWGSLETIAGYILLATLLAIFWGALNVLSDYEDMLIGHMHSHFLHGLLNLAVLAGAILAVVAFICVGGSIWDKVVWHWRVHRWALKQVKR